MIILGYSAYIFDSAACLIKDGKIIAACQEERLTRNKNTGEFPKEAISFCLKEAGISLNEVDHVCFYWQPLSGLTNRFIQILKSLPKSLKFWGTHSGKWLSMLLTNNELKRNFPGNHRYKFHFVKHHICHAASSFFVSPFKEANILIMDGSGEISATSLAVGLDQNIEILSDINFPHSLGYLYVSLTHYLGFKPDSDEYKVMALASMGKNSKYYDLFKKIITLLPDGKYQFNLKYFAYHEGSRDPWVSKKFIEDFGELRLKDSTIEQRHQDIAWALQKRLQDVALHCCEALYKLNPCDNLIISGGVGLNCVMNEVLYQKSPYKNVWVMSAPHDAGTSLGAAYWVYCHKLGYPRNYVYETALLGPQYSDQEIKEVLLESKLPFKELNEDEILEKTSQLLTEQNIIGWFQGRTEFGPRALGNRSIIADPRTIEMKNKINERIKHREEFRPFAPAILEDRVEEYFMEGRKLPFMTCVLSAIPDKIETIRAVVHFDHTSRVQTVSKEVNPIFYKLIKEFDRLTGVPVLLNTSFNDNGEPIVNSPQDAISCFKRTNLDYLVLGSFLIKQTKEIL